MDGTIDRIRVLRKAATDAMSDFRGALKEVARIGVYEAEFKPKTHDNVRIVESDSEEFEWTLDRDKHQVVVVLTGSWTMKHGKAERELGPTDTLKIPVGSPVDTIMTTDEVGAKFVYVQFKL